MGTLFYKGVFKIAKVYICPFCKTNKIRFNLIEQVVTPIKKDPKTGKIIEILEEDPLQIKYNGSKYIVQCGTCGAIEDERMFIKK